MTKRVFRAPGRVNLIGEHTDYSGGLVLPAALELGITLEAELGGDRIQLTSAQQPERVDVAADGAGPAGAGWSRYVAAVAVELAALGRPPVGLAGMVASDLPQGTGLSSSAALEVAVGLALCAAADFAVTPMDLVFACQRAEHRAVDVPTGIMDQAASLLGRAGCALLLDCATLEHHTVPLPDDLALVIIDSATPRTLEGSGYAQRRAELESALHVLGERRPTEVAPDELDGLLGGLDEVAARRLRHVLTENWRVLAVERALAAPQGADRAALGRLFAQGHASLRDDYEVSTPQLDLLVQLAVDAGAVAARMTGGGFGGAIVALAGTGDAERLGAEVAASYRQHTGRSATVLESRAGDGAREVTR